MKKSKFQYGFSYINAKATRSLLSVPPAAAAAILDGDLVHDDKKQRTESSGAVTVSRDVPTVFYMGDFGGGGLELFRVSCNDDDDGTLIIEDFAKDRFLRGPGKQQSFLDEICLVFANIPSDQEAQLQHRDRIAAYLCSVDESLLEHLVLFIERSFASCEGGGGEGENIRLCVDVTGKLRNEGLYGTKTAVENIILSTATNDTATQEEKEADEESV